jgi:hypothetical protein
MKKPNKAANSSILEVVPEIYAPGESETVAIEQVPALQKISCDRRPSDQAINSTFRPAREIYVTKNANGTFATLNNLLLIAPEACRITSSRVRVTVLDLSASSEEEIEEIRSYLLYVDPFRHVGSGPEIAELAYEGIYDSLGQRYGSERSVPGKFQATAALFPDNPLAKSTFDRVQAERKDPSKKTRRNVDNRTRKMLALKRKRAEEKAKRRKKNERQEKLFKE